MGKRYFCDFCEKTFPYNVENRKKHNSGVQHQMNRNAYYSKFKDLKTVLAEEHSKKPCYRFFNQGFCSFGDNCRLSHLNSFELKYLEELCNYEKSKEYTNEQHNEKNKKPPNNKTKRYESELLNEHLSREDQELLENYLPRYELPKCLKFVTPSTIPASLQPPSFRDFIDYDLNSWG